MRPFQMSRIRPRRFYGWWVVGLAVITVAMTSPGQTIGVSVFIDPMIETLAVSRSEVSVAYLVGTLLGGLSMPFVGRLIDRWGVRRMMILIGALFGVAVASMSGVGGLVAMAAGFTGIRLLGQGALTLTSTTAVALWFEHRRGLAMGTTSSLGVGLMSLAPVVLSVAIASYGWRTAWVLAGLAVWAVVLPIALLAMRDSPASIGQQPDGDAPPDPQAPAVHRESWTRGEAARTLMFWAIAGAMAATALVVTAVSFHQISLLGEQGLTRAQAAAVFVPHTAAFLGGTFLAGALLDRIPAKLVGIASMGLLVAGLVFAQMAAPGWRVLAYAMTMGASAGSTRAMEAASTPRFFGVRHVGAIRGLLMSVSVIGAALGPYLLAAGHDRFGSYDLALSGLIALPATVTVLMLVARTPDESLHARVQRRLGSRAES